MTDNRPRAAIHAGKDKKTFSAQVSNEAERRGWDEKRYQQKNAESEKNNHYNFSRKHLNFEIIKGGKIIPLGSNPIPAHQRLQQRFDELCFKPYMDKEHPDQIAKNSPNCAVGILFGGDHDVMKRLAFGDQKFDPADPYSDHSHIVLRQGIYQWAMDTYDFACRKWGEENIISFAVHLDETSVHAHVQTIPVEKVKKRGRIGNKYVNKEKPDLILSTKEWKALPKEERDNYIKTKAEKDYIEQVSYAKVWGEHTSDRSQYLSLLHTDYHNEVGYKYGLERGFSFDELSPEEKRERRHKDKVTLEAERQAKQAIAEAEKKKAEIVIETANVMEQKEKAQKDLKTAQSGFFAKFFQPGKYKQEEAAKVAEAYNAGVKETIETIVKASGLNWKGDLTAERLGQQFRMAWDSNKNFSQELKSKDGTISEKEAEINRLNVMVSTLQEEINGLKYRLTLFDPKARRDAVLDRFVSEGHNAVLSFARTSRVDFDEHEASSIFYGIIATATQKRIDLGTESGIKAATEEFLSGISWKGFTEYKENLVSGWTRGFATSEVTFTDSAISNFISFIDHMSCSAETYVSLGGSNGCADQLTNWDGTKKVGMGPLAIKSKVVKGY